MKLTFAEWLSEREANARQIAASKHGIDKAGWMEDAEYFKQAAALAARPVTPAPECLHGVVGECQCCQDVIAAGVRIGLYPASVSKQPSTPDAPIAWWNGIRKTGDGFRDMDQPSFAEQEGPNHDIPVFSGCNPHSNEARLSRAARIVAGQAGEDSAKFIDWLCDGGFVQMALSHFGRPASAPEALTPEWLWSRLMDWCKKHGYAPAQWGDLFEIVKEARALAAPSTPPEAPVEQKGMSIARALREGLRAETWLNGGTGPVACVGLCAIQLQGWTHTAESAKAYADAYNRGADDMRAALAAPSTPPEAPEWEDPFKYSTEEIANKQGFQPAATQAQDSGKASEPFLYAIMGPDGAAHLDEQCVSSVRGDLDDTVFSLNDEHVSGPYRVVELFRPVADAATRPVQPAAAAAPDHIADASKMVAACEWSYESDPTDAWATGCGNMFSFTDGGPPENEFRFCCYCGGGLALKGVA